MTIFTRMKEFNKRSDEKENVLENVSDESLDKNRQEEIDEEELAVSNESKVVNS